MPDPDLDHPDSLEHDSLTDEEAELFPLFAEALDLESPVTVDDVVKEWST
jgi:hypothetical protein